MHFSYSFICTFNGIKKEKKERCRRPWRRLWAWNLKLRDSFSPSFYLLVVIVGFVFAVLAMNVLNM